MTLEQMLLEIAARYPEQPAEDNYQAPIVCRSCNYSENVGDDGLCDDCRITIKRGYKISALAGRCANGAERDRGTLWHARLLDRDNSVSWIAVCGYKPGRRSAGWSNYVQSGSAVTCPKCASKLRLSNQPIAVSEE